MRFSPKGLASSATVLFCCAVLFLAACGPAYRGEPVVGPLSLSEPELLQGQQVFMAHCHSCHPGGAAGLGPSLNDKPLPGGLIAFQVRNGLGVMPAFSSEEMSDADLSALVAYLQALREHSGDAASRD
ncbi:MAG: cytochrome c [Deinococcota bacterium]|nr:cytochrome c [Deinococcota bacterium]